MKKVFAKALLSTLLMAALVPLFITEAHALDREPDYLGADYIGTDANTPNLRVVKVGGTKWLVIGYDGNGALSGTGEIVLFADNVLLSCAYNDPGDAYYDGYEYTKEAMTYKGSTLERTIDQYVKDNFTAGEIESIIPRQLEAMDIPNDDAHDDQWWDDNFHTIDKVPYEGVNALAWPLSAKEAYDDVPQFIRMFASEEYWLRTLGSGQWLELELDEWFPPLMATVDTNGYVTMQNWESEDLTDSHGVRPAIKLKKDNIVFTTELENKIWKLTLKDSRHKNFSVDVCDSTLDSNGDLVVKYQNGVPGDNEYVSYLIANANGTIAKYGRCGKVTAASGTATLTGLPKDASGKIALEAGTKLYVFNEQDNGEKTDYSSNLIEVGTTSGHDWGEPSYEWAADNSSVTAKRVCKRDSSHVETETVDTTSEVTTQPTCEGKGKTTYTATFEKDAFETQTKTVEDIDALDHDWGDWTVTTAPTCSAEGEEERVCKRDSAHKDTGKVAIDDDAHEWTFAEFTWTGNETDGYTAVAASYVCKHDSGHTTSANASLSEEVTESTCTAPGKTAYTATIAAADSLDGQEHTEAKDAKPTDPKEHDWNAPTYTWADDNSSVTATRVCKRDASHVEHETAEASSSVTKQPTCEEKGETTYTATFENTAFEKQTKTVEDIDALNHDWGEWTVTTAPTCTEEGEETRTCSHDASHTETRAIDALGHDWGEWTQAKAPTCTEEGEETRTCGHDASHTETRAIDALGHDWGEWTVTKEPTTEAEGEQTRTCARCSEVETRAIPKLDPKPVPTPINYRNTEGNGTQWTKGSSATADFTFKRSKNDGETFSHFTGIQVDGKGVASSNYIAESGSVVVKLKPAYLETLAVGEHTITALFDDGNSASAKFTVVAKKSAANGTAPKGNATAKTGDSGALLGFTALCVASLALLGAGKARRERSLPRK